jgi:DNA/RNA endonuclease YhcR with UshA esterase domain
MRRVIAAGVLLLGAVVAGADDKKLAVVPAAEALQHDSEKCVVEMEVKATGQSKDGKMIFLNSEKNRNDDKNFTVVIDAKAQEKFTKAGVKDIRKEYDGKKIKVTGVISLYQKKAQIRINDPKDIEAAEKPAEKP